MTTAAGRITRVLRLRHLTLALAVLGPAMIIVTLAQAAVSSDLRSATITVQNASLPPPYGRAHVHRYTTRAAVAKVTKALKANHNVTGLLSALGISSP